MTIQITTKLKAELCFIAFLCAAAISVELLSLFSALRPSSETAATWFQRSGAITSIFSAFAQYRMGNFLESIRGGTFAESWWLFNLFKAKQYVISWVIAIVTIWGALVWGYGDLLVNHIARDGSARTTITAPMHTVNPTPNPAIKRTGLRPAAYGAR